MEITLSIKGQELKILGKQPNLYHGSIGVLYIKFCDVNFDTTLVKTVRFKTEESDWYTADVVDGRVRVPHEVIVVGGFDVAVGGYETADGELLRFLPTNSVHIDVFENGYGEPDSPLETEGEPESFITKLYGKIDKKADLEYVKSLIPINVVEGEFVSLTDYADSCGISGYRIFGNSVQDTRSGKNVFDIYSFAEEINKTAKKGYEVVYERFDEKDCLKVYGLSSISASYSMILKDSTRYCISLDYLQVPAYGADGVEYWGPSFSIVYTDGTSERLIGDTKEFNSWRHLSFVTAEGKTVSHIRGSYGTGAAYTYISNWQIEEGMQETEYELYGMMPSEEFPSEVKSVGEYLGKDTYKIPIIVKTSNEEIKKEFLIYVKEPLRRLNNKCDYIDFFNQCVVRNIEVLDISGTMSLNESLAVLKEPIYEKIELPQIVLPEDDTVNISVDTSVPANIELTYYQDINKVIAELKATHSA